MWRCECPFCDTYSRNRRNPPENLPEFDMPGQLSRVSSYAHRASRTEKGLDKIYLPTQLAAQELGCHPHTLRKWSLAGAPHQKSGRRLEFNIKDVRNWIIQQRMAESLVGHTISSTRIPTKEARPILREAKRKLGFTVEEMADELDLKRITMMGYLSGDKIKTIPREIVSKAEFLAEALAPKRHPLIRPTFGKVKDALIQTFGVRWQAIRILGIGTRMLNTLIDEYDLLDYVTSQDSRDRFTKRQIVEALTLAKGKKGEAARLLGVSRKTFLNLMNAL